MPLRRLEVYQSIVHATVIIKKKILWQSHENEFFDEVNHMVHY